MERIPKHSSSKGHVETVLIQPWVVHSHREILVIAQSVFGHFGVIENWRHLPSLHWTVIGLTPERVALGLLSWTHLRTRYWSVFTLQATRRFASCSWPMVLRKLGNRWKWKGESWFHCRKVFFLGLVGIADVLIFGVVRKTASGRENRRELLGDEVMKTASNLSSFYRAGNRSLFLHLQSHFVHFSQDH